MSSFEKALAHIGLCLDELRRPWALVGALAVAARAEARATLDVDVVVAADRGEISEVKDELRRAGFRWHRDFGQAMTSFLVSSGPEAGLRLDVLFSLTELEAEIAARAERIEILPGVEMPVATTGDLIALKLLGSGLPGREHDLRDLRSLVDRATPEDLQMARSAVDLLGRRRPEDRQGLEDRWQELVEGRE